MADTDWIVKILNKNKQAPEKTPEPVFVDKELAAKLKAQIAPEEEK